MSAMPIKKRKKIEDIPHAWEFPAITFQDAVSIKALLEGEATGEQQKQSLDWIIRVASDFYGMSYRPGGLEGDRESCFAEGKRFVGNAITYVLNMKSTQLEELKELSHGGRTNFDE